MKQKKRGIDTGEKFMAWITSMKIDENFDQNSHKTLCNSLKEKEMFGIVIEKVGIVQQLLSPPVDYNADEKWLEKVHFIFLFICSIKI